MVGRLSSMAVLPFEKDYGVLGADLILSMCIKVLAETLAAVPALYFTVLPRISPADPLVADEQARLRHGGTGVCDSASPGFAEPCLATELATTIIDSTASEEYNPSTCKVHDENLRGPDVSSRLKSKEINGWLAVAKNKDDDDDDDDDEEEDDDEDDDDDDAADEEDAADDGEGDEGVPGHGGGAGGDDEEDDDDDDDDDENGKGDDEEDDEDGVEAEDDDDEDGVDDEEDEDDEDDDDETPEPPQKKRK